MGSSGIARFMRKPFRDVLSLLGSACAHLTSKKHSLKDHKQLCCNTLCPWSETFLSGEGPLIRGDTLEIEPMSRGQSDQLREQRICPNVVLFLPSWRVCPPPLLATVPML